MCVCVCVCVCVGGDRPVPHTCQPGPQATERDASVLFGSGTHLLKNCAGQLLLKTNSAAVGQQWGLNST